jgi:hypothetical protein
MLVLVDEYDRQPLVAQISSPRTTVTLEGSSGHHVSVKIDDGGIPLYLVMTAEVAAQLVLRLSPTVGAQVAWLLSRDES